jgi:type I restriction enzyme S subunit
VAAEAGVVNQIEYHGRSYAGVSVEPYNVIRKGEIVYTKSPLKAYPYGIIKFNEGKDGIVSTLYAVYRVNKKASGKFLDYYFMPPMRVNKYLKPLVNIGAKNDMKVNNDVVLSGLLRFPRIEEQEKIAEFMGGVDNKLTSIQTKVTAMHEYKKGVMQALFSGKLRFKDENGNSYPEWEEKKLGAITSRVTRKNGDSSIHHVLTNSATAGIVNQSDYFDKDIANQSNLAGYYVVSKDDFVYNPRISQSAPVGPIKRNNLGTGVMSPLYTVFRFMEGNSKFFEMYFNTKHWHEYMRSVANSGARHDRMNITTGDFYNLPVPFPCPEEQKKIADFLTALDDKIKLEEAKVAKSKEFKKGLLQRMFV